VQKVLNTFSNSLLFLFAMHSLIPHVSKYWTFLSFKFSYLYLSSNSPLFESQTTMIFCILIASITSLFKAYEPEIAARVT
jgi:hypothetical protein